MEKAVQRIKKKYKLKLNRVFGTFADRGHFVFQLGNDGQLICCSIEVLNEEPFLIGYPNVWQVSDVSPEGKQIDGRLFVSECPKGPYSWFDVQSIIYLLPKQQERLYRDTI
ncbi:MAG: hypothetical protein J7623_17150 [Chitinophaga sp.]|uniref:hypothetical protein n=1 Tax=Chitinophaga sp. TaxID=1869181 RepID=UPI001B10E562|nr:hypothetical protein [Chitinophaga sp.]MBO9730371.1 hypothetical protein [Chitinophaga sp.]